jgi:hypothetical protein
MPVNTEYDLYVLPWLTDQPTLFPGGVKLIPLQVNPGTKYLFILLSIGNATA